MIVFVTFHLPQRPDLPGWCPVAARGHSDAQAAGGYVSPFYLGPAARHAQINLNAYQKVMMMISLWFLGRRQCCIDIPVYGRYRRISSSS